MKGNDNIEEVYCIIPHQVTIFIYLINSQYPDIIKFQKLRTNMIQIPYIKVNYF